MNILRKTILSALFLAISVLLAEAQTQTTREEYIEKYKKVLTNQKIYMVYKAELKFNRNMMKILQEMEDKKK